MHRSLDQQVSINILKKQNKQQKSAICFVKMAADSECNSPHISRDEMFPLGTYVMCKRRIATARFSHGVVTMIDASRGIGVHYWTESQLGGFDFEFAYFKDANLLQYPDLAAKQKVQVRETRNSTTWQLTEVVQRLQKRALTLQDVSKHQLAWEDRGRLVSVFLVAGAKPDDTACEKWAFNIRSPFWGYKKTPTLSHKDLFSHITYGGAPKRPSKRKASPTTAMVPKKARQPQTNTTLQYMDQAVRLMHEITKLFRADATEVHQFISSQFLQASHAARERLFESSGKMCIFHEQAGSRSARCLIYIPADYRGEQESTLPAVPAFRKHLTNPFFMSVMQAALDKYFNSKSIAEKKKWVARGPAAIHEDLRKHWVEFLAMQRVAMQTVPDEDTDDDIER